MSAAERPLRVAFLTHYYPPEVGAPQARISGLAGGLRRAGVDVTIHTGFPNYPTGRVQPPYRNRLRQREATADGLQVIRSAVVPTANAGFVPRLANHTAFATSAILTANATGRQDVVVVETPPLFTAGAGVLYARLKRAPMIAHVSDLWPSSAVQLGALADRRVIRAAEGLERWVYRHAAAITVPTQGMVRTLDGQMDSAGKVRRMRPVVDLARFPEQPLPPLDGPLRVVYGGTVGLAHGIENLIDAAALAGPDVVDVTVAGWGAEGAFAQGRIAARGVGNIRLLGLVPPVHVSELYQRCHAGVVLLKDLPLFAEALPTKLFECMAAARPVVLSARGEAADVVASVHGGDVVTPEDPVALAASFRRLRSMSSDELAAMGRRGRAHVADEASLDGSVGRWLDLLETVGAQRARR